MKHTIEPKDLDCFESKTQIAGAFGRGEDKSLNIFTKVTIAHKIHSRFTVEHRNNEIFQSEDLKEAIIEYNKL